MLELLIFIIISLILTNLYLYYYVFEIEFLEYYELCSMFKKQNEYFQKFDKYNLHSRNIISKDLKKYYCDNSLSFNNYQKNNISKILLSLKNAYNLNFFKCLWKFGLVNNNLEGGMPHTHSDVIIFSEKLVNNLVVSNNSKSLFIHERTHVIQRKYIEDFVNLYKNYWNFIRVKVNNKLKINIRLNPDGPNSNWVFKFNNTYIWPIAVFKSKNLVDCRYVGVYLKKKNDIFYADNSCKVKDLVDCPEYNDFFGNINNSYHPNEIAADYMSMYILKNHISNIGFKKFKNWIHKSNILNKN